MLFLMQRYLSLPVEARNAGTGTENLSNGHYYLEWASTKDFIIMQLYFVGSQCPDMTFTEHYSMNSVSYLLLVLYALICIYTTLLLSLIFSYLLQNVR